MRVSKYDIVLIRHAQSLFNEATVKTAAKLDLDNLSWDELIENQQFNKLVTYNHLYMDPPLSQKGRNQCQSYRKECQKINPDLILVSPYRRALETCNQLFTNCKSPVFVQPILSEVFRFACDVPEQFQSVKKSFPRFDFSKVEAFGNEWFLQNLAPDFQTKIKSQVSLELHQENRRQLLQLLQKKQIRENAKMLRDRAAGIKKMLREYKKKYQKIVVVAHYYIIEFVKSVGFDEKDQLIQYNGIMNCHPYYENLHQLEKII